MNKHLYEFNDIIELLLGPIRERPAMYLGEAKISLLASFITGYQMRYYMSQNKDEKYFGENGFIAWYFKKNNIISSTWHTVFLEKAKNDEWEALQLFFYNLEEFSKEDNK